MRSRAVPSHTTAYDDQVIVKFSAGLCSKGAQALASSRYKRPATIKAASRAVASVNRNRNQRELGSAGQIVQPWPAQAFPFEAAAYKIKLLSAEKVRTARCILSKKAAGQRAQERSQNERLQLCTSVMVMLRSNEQQPRLAMHRPQSQSCLWIVKHSTYSLSLKAR